MVVGVAAGAATAPYLARLTLSVPDRDERRWWSGRPAGAGRTLGTGLTAVALGGIAGAAAKWHPVLAVFVAIALICAPLVIIDIEHHRLPDRLVFTGAAVGVVGFLAVAIYDGRYAALARSVEAAAAVFAALLLLAIISPASFGLGDVKLGAVLGLPLGWLSWTTVLAGTAGAFVLSGLVSLLLLALRRITMKSHLPFGPPLIFGTLLAAALGLGTI